MDEGVEYLKLNELISNGLISRNEKADVAWLALKDVFPFMNQDKFRRTLLRCRISHAIAGKFFFDAWNMFNVKHRYIYSYRN